MRILLRLVAIVCNLFVCKIFAQNDSSLFELNIIHHNDFHARFEETSPASVTCTDPTIENGTTCIGGFARLYTAIAEKMELKPDSILLDAGDVFQGTIWYTLLKWNVTQFFLNQLPHDAHVLGNHEFDDGIEGVVPYMEHLQAPVVVANIDSTNETDFKDYSKSVVIQRNGRNIGIIGVIISSTPEMAKTGNLIFLDEVESVKQEAENLNDQGVDIIIVLSHCGLDIDRKLAQEAGPYIDIIVGGHSHTLLFTGDAPSGETPVADYPVLEVNGDTQRLVPIVQASAHTKYLGEISLFFNSDGVLESFSGEPMYLENSILEDPLMLELLAPFKEEVDLIGKREVGSTRVQLSRSACGNSECNLGSFICDAFVDSTIENAEEEHWTHAAICITNQGGIRSPINRGDISMEDLVLAVPFENTVDTFLLKGSYLSEAFEYSVSWSWNEPEDGFFGGSMLQVSGVRAVYNVSLPVGQRVQQLLVRCAHCAVPEYKPIDPNEDYRIVSQSFIRTGGDGYQMIALNHEDLVVGLKDIDILQRYVAKQSPIMQSLDGRIQLHEN